MANRQIVWPAGKEDERDAYADEADVQWKIITSDPTGIWTYRREDAFGQPYCAFLGPPQVYDGNVIVEPPSCAALRENGVIVDAVVLPDDDE